MADNETSKILERRNKCRDWMRLNVWPEWIEAWRNIKCRTKPIYKRDKNGKETTEEDKSRTNVCMPETSIIHRKNWARLCGQPYRLKYIGGSDPTIADRLSALAAQQYDRSNEAMQDMRIVGWAEAIGIGCSKLYWDTLSRTMQFRKAVMMGGQVAYRDRASIMRASGAPQEEVDDAVRNLGADMSDEEVAQAIGKSGTEINVPTEIKKYEGPCVKALFPGDIFYDHNFLSMDDADCVIEQYRETDLWLARQVKALQYEDESGNLVQAFDPVAVKALLDTDPEPTKKSVEYDLKQQLEQTVGRMQLDGLGDLPRNLRVRKRYNILEQHALESDGRVWITWISEDYTDKPLGKMPYPWDLYGKYVYTELTPLPDLISGFGESTPRQLRYLQALHNMTVAQNFDYVSNVLKPFIKTLETVELEDEAVVRSGFRELKVPRMDAVQFEQIPQLPQSAFEREAQILRMEALAEPAMNTVDTGSAGNPMAGKLATTAMINAKSGDLLTQFKTDRRNAYLRELGLKKLWMNQQAAQDEWEIESRYMNQQAMQGLEGQPEQQRPEWVMSDRYGKVVATKLSTFDIQEDLQVEPEAMSYLAVDDELRRAAANDMAQIAMQAPGTVDLRKVIRYALSTVRGIGNPDDFILPEQPPQPTPPKVGVNISVALEKQQPTVQAQLLQLAGINIPQADTDAAQMVHGMKTLQEGANAATDMLSPATPQPQAPPAQ